jgi:hypothetical protein
MTRNIAYHGSKAINVELPYFFKDDDDDGNEIFGRIEDSLITILHFISMQQSAVIFSRLWYPDHFPILDTGHPVTDCKQITKERFEAAQIKAQKMLRII